jgi:septum formation protein
MSTIILASQSPRRQQLLAEMGIQFIVQQADIDETPPANCNAYEVPQLLAQKKAEKIASTQEDAIIIAADTLVIINHSILINPRIEKTLKKCCNYFLATCMKL